MDIRSNLLTIGMWGLHRWLWPMFLALCWQQGCVGSKVWKNTWSPGPLTFSQASKIETRKETVTETKRYPVDLPVVIQLSQIQSLDIAFVRERLHEAYAKTLLAQQQFFPTIRIYGNYFRHENEIQDTTGNFLDVEKQSLFMGGKLEAQIRPGEAIFATLAAHRRYRAGEFELRQTEMETALKAASAYFDLVEFYGQARILEEAASLAQALLDESKQYVEMGKGNQASLSQAQVELSYNKSLHAQALKNIERTAIELATLLHLTPDIALYPDPLIAEPIQLVFPSSRRKEGQRVNGKWQAAQLLEEVQRNYPRLHQARLLLSALQHEKEASLYAPLIPTIMVQSSIGAFGPRLSDMKNQEIYTIGVGWEIGPGGLLDFGRMELQDARERQAEIQLAQVYEEVSQKVYATHAQIEALTSVIANLRVAKEEAAMLVQINRERQKQGVATPLEIVQAERDLTQARLNYLRAVSEYNKSQWRLYLMLGNLEKRKEQP